MKWVTGMPRDLSVALLDDLEARRGLLTESEYAAERIQIEELIRRGRAVSVTPRERIAQAVLVAAGVCFAAFFFIAEIAVLGLVAFAACLFAAWRLGRP